MAVNIEKQLEAFAVELETALGDNLLAFCLYGPAVRHDVDNGDVSTLLVLKDAGPNALHPIARAVHGWTKRGYVPPLIFAEQGWRASTDVFPIEIEDMREAHRVLHGSSPFENMKTTGEDLRRELEREVRSKLLRLRTELVAAATSGKLLERLLLESIGTFFVLFRATLRLVGTPPPQEREPLVRAVADAAGLDVAAFGWVLDRLAGRKAAALTPSDPVGDRYLEQIERLALFVDTHAAGAPTAEEN